MSCCRPRQIGPIVHPTRTIVRDVYHRHTVPHIHPTQTIVRHNQIINNQHMFPHVRRDVPGRVRQYNTCCSPRFF